MGWGLEMAAGGVVREGVHGEPETERVQVQVSEVREEPTEKGKR